LESEFGRLSIMLKSTQIKDPQRVTIGMWASQSCHTDLHQIKSQDEIETILSDWDDGVDYDVWKTKKEALEEIKISFRHDPEELAIIHQMMEEKTK